MLSCTSGFYSERVEVAEEIVVEFSESPESFEAMRRQQQQHQ